MTHQHNHRDPACLEIFAKLSEYVDGELDAQDCQDVESHIADCPPCIEFLESLKRCVAAGQSLQGREECPPVPPELEQRLKSAWHAALARRQQGDSSPR